MIFVEMMNVKEILELIYLKALYITCSMEKKYLELEDAQIVVWFQSSMDLITVEHYNANVEMYFALNA